MSGERRAWLRGAGILGAIPGAIPGAILGATLGALGLSAAIGVILYIHRPTPLPAFEDVRAAYVPSDAWLLDRHGAVLDSRRIRYDVRRLEWVPLRDVSPALVTAIVAGEDRGFWQHHGVEWRSLLGAVRDQLWRHRRRGASTITMQLASLLQHRRHPSGPRALLDKLAQMRAAHSLEQQWSKPQILEAYLNLLTYQGELEGIGAATAQLAGKTPSGLSTPESLILAALLPAPDANSKRVAARACVRAREMQPRVDCTAVRAAADELLGTHPPPAALTLAPQLAQRLLHTAGERLPTTLDASIQRLAQNVLRTHLSALADHNVRDGAAIVVENATGEVLAYVGSAGMQSRAPQVDGVQAARQAGSTLKPFLYELALERRYLTAASLLADSPVSLETASGVYLPQDYDHDFKGLVSVRTALAGSLNVPAVRTLVLVGVEALRDRLQDLGFRDITHDGSYYGYSLALGSAEVSLWQQAQAYRSLARGGVWSPIRLQPANDDETAQRILDPAASFVVADILSDPAARAITFGLDNHLALPFWSAVKTGTSEDMRDNWCVGFTHEFTVAVWVGNFEGDSMRDVSGVTGAAPIWHDIVMALQSGAPSPPPAAPPELISQLTHFSPAVEPPRREWYLSGTQLTTPSAAPSDAPSVARAIAIPASARPSIESPANGVIIAVDPDIPADHQKVLFCVKGGSPAMQLRLNGQPLGSAINAQLWAPHPGAYYLTLADAQGRALDRVLFTVRNGRP